MAKATTLKATIQAAMADGKATVYDEGNTVLFDGILYSVRKGSSPYRRMPAQRENRRRLGINQISAKATTDQKVGTVRAIIVPPVGRGRRAFTADFARMIERLRAKGELSPATVKV